MTIHQQIKADVKTAMKERAAAKLAAARNLLSALTNELVATGQKPDGELDDAGAIAVVKRSAKQRQDSIQQFTAGGRADLAADEEKELAYLKNYLPAELAPAEIEKIVKETISETGFKTKADLGKLIGAAMKKLQGRADGAVVKAVAEKLV